MSEKTSAVLTDDELREIIAESAGDLLADETIAAMARELLANRARIAELEAAQSDPAGYMVGWRSDDGRVCIELDENEEIVSGATTRAHASTAAARAFLAECGPADPRTEFAVYALHEVSDHA